MKLDINDNNLLIKIKDSGIKTLNFDDMSCVEKYFKKVLLQLKDLYKIDIKGFYNIYAYIDLDEGIVLEIKKEDIDYYDSFHQLELRIIKENTIFLYEIDDIIDFLDKNLTIYNYDNSFYVRNNYCSLNYDLYEFGKLVYKDTANIIENGKKVTIL